MTRGCPRLPCLRAPFPATYGPECTTMELTFSIPASFKLGQGVFSSWQRPWKFSCSKRAIWEGEKRGRQSLWGALDQEGKKSPASGPGGGGSKMAAASLSPTGRGSCSPPAHPTLSCLGWAH